ncbi:armadillo-type protein [Radiomyces spectabilis]|uniref:armadillo-type protein n=1 Tax=Radiomyces spectabilis TaxID=64574 RepID=UPI00221E8117|nr:armadillo-type protein [Radiomyces spectabilis]KAI8373136.1 armadillo-type protein [Radiomyces spectabilis]
MADHEEAPQLNINYDHLEAVLCNTSNDVPLAERFRALFTLKNVADEKSINIIAKALSDDSALLKHELTYCLGQIGNPCANPILVKVLEDTQEDEMVRHEAAEALGAIGSAESLPVLEKFLKDPSEAVVETCELAIDKIKYDNDPKTQAERESHKSVYNSVDPAPPTTATRSVQELGDRLCDTNLSLFERYRAMFALREIGTSEAVLALAKGLKDKSALFRHEVAYVFGQLQHPASVPALTETLIDKNEAHMVRHEAAEALGSIATPEVLETLQKFKEDNARVVRESCVVALDMYEYETSGDFQYANGLEKEPQNMHSLKLA